MEHKKCPKCESENIGKGKFNDYTVIIPLGKFFGSRIIADICTDCGHVFEMKVTKPEKFKDSNQIVQLHHGAGQAKYIREASPIIRGEGNGGELKQWMV